MVDRRVASTIVAVILGLVSVIAPQEFGGVPPLPPVTVTPHSESPTGVLSAAVHPSLAPPTAVDEPRWSVLAEAHGPPRVSAHLATDPSSGAVLWWGVVGTASLTWQFDSGRWVNLTGQTGAGPPADDGAVLASAPDVGGVVWVGGLGPAGATTWVFANGTWSNVTGALVGAPAHREAGTAAWDGGDGEVVLFGGWGGTGYLNDTWTLHSGAWTRVAVNGPSPRASSGMAYDATGGDTLLVGGGTAAGIVNDTWRFLNGSWTGPFAGPPVGAGDAGSLAAGPGGSLVAFGGSGCPLPLAGPCNQSYTLSAGRWVSYDAGPAPTPRVGLALAYDPSDGEMVGWGGTQGTLLLNDTWSLGGRLNLSVTVRPPAVGVDEPTVFLASAAGGYGAVHYGWANGPLDCPTADTSLIVCESEIPGSYLVRGSDSDGLGNTSNATAPLTVLARFASTLTIQPAVTDVGELVQLSVTLVGGASVANTTWSGLPPGCVNSFSYSVLCRPLSPGFFSPIATVTDSLGHVAPTPPVGLLVHSQPIVALATNRTAGEDDLTVGLTATVAGGTAPFQYSWSFGDNTSSNVSSPSHIYTVPGSHNVSLLLTDSIGVTASATLDTPIVTVPPLIVGPPETLGAVAGAIAQFSTNVSGGEPPYSFFWTFGDGTNSTAVAPSHQFESAGPVSVTVLVSDSIGDTVASSDRVVVQPAHAATGSSLPTWSIELVLALAGAAGGALVTIGWVRRGRSRAAGPPPPVDSGPRPPP